jgi:hypothetical protein
MTIIFPCQGLVKGCRLTAYIEHDYDGVFPLGSPSYSRERWFFSLLRFPPPHGIASRSGLGWCGVVRSVREMR